MTREVLTKKVLTGKWMCRVLKHTDTKHNFCCLMEASGGVFRLDVLGGMRFMHKCDFEIPNVEVDVHTLKSITKTKEIRMEWKLDGENIDPVSGAITINGTITIKARKVDAINHSFSGECYIIKASDMEEIYKRILPAACTDECRNAINNVNCADENVVATDGHRLHILARRNHNIGQIPLDVFNVFHSANDSEDSEVYFGKDDHGSFMIHENIFMRFDRDFGEYPNYLRILEYNHDFQIGMEVNRDDLLKAVEAIPGYKQEAHHDASIVLDNPDHSIRVKTHKASDIKAENTVPVQYTKGETKPTETIGVNKRYLVEAIKACTSEKIEVRFIDNLSPVVIVDGNFLALIMPVRV